MLSFPDTAALLRPETISLDKGSRLFTFPSNSTELIKLDFIFDAGHIHQQQPLCAVAAAKLMTVATRDMDAQRLAEYLDARGVVTDSAANLFTSTFTAYTHRRYAADIVSVLHDMLSRPAFEESDFEVWRSAKRQEIAVLQQRTSAVARRLWYETLFGADHPLGHYASPQDADTLQLDAVRDFFGKHYHPHKCSIVLSGGIDQHLCDLVGSTFARSPLAEAGTSPLIAPPLPSPSTRRLETGVQGAQQASLRIGCPLPMRDEIPLEDAVRLAACVTLLGGYFGSRLMSNLREDKGYTYGIYAHIQQYRSCRLLFIAADVAAASALDAEKEVMLELRRLADEPPSEEELDAVLSTMAGDAMRLLDGVFERSDRWCEQQESGPLDIWHTQFADILKTTTPQHLSELAHKWLHPDRMVSILALPE